MVKGLMVYGASTLLTSGDEVTISQEPVYLPAEMIDAAILEGKLQAGAFRNVTVQPPAEEWPERWRFLKE